MQSIRTLIVDDERLSRQALRVLLARDREVEIVGEAADGEAALDLIRRLHPRLLFLDVQMPMLNGLEMLGHLAQSERPEVVFVTAHENYARPAFDVWAVDYLMKPFSDSRFAAALERAKRRLADTSLQGTEQALRDLLKQLQKAVPMASKRKSGLRARVPYRYERIVVKADGQLHFLSQREIRWIKAQGDYAKIHLKTRSLLVRITMSRIERDARSGPVLSGSTSRRSSTSRMCAECCPCWRPAAEWSSTMERRCRLAQATGRRSRTSDRVAISSGMRGMAAPVRAMAGLPAVPFGGRLIAGLRGGRG
jgi:two-component system LytT family response regulator